MAIIARTVKNRKDANGQMSGRSGTVYDVNIKYKTYEGYKTYNKKGFATRKDATQHETEMRQKLAKPGYAATTSKNQKQFLATYLLDWFERYAKKNLRPNTINGYRVNIIKHINPVLGNISLSDLHGRDLDDLYTRMFEQGLSTSTVKYVHRTLSVALEHARRYRMIEDNPAKDILTKFQNDVDVPDPYNVDQMRKLLKSVANTHWEITIILGGLYGLRRNEVLGLRWKDVDLAQGSISISSQLATPDKISDDILHAPLKESYSLRLLPMTELSKPVFQKLYAIANVRLDDKPDPNSLVVCHANGKPFSAGHISRDFGHLLVKLEMPRIRFHDLRHSAATNMHELTGDFFTVGEILGHSLKGIGIQLGLSGTLEAVTERYVDVRMERKRIVLDAYHRAVLKEKSRELER
jgi:integrase